MLCLLLLRLLQIFFFRKNISWSPFTMKSLTLLVCQISKPVTYFVLLLMAHFGNCHTFKWFCNLKVLECRFGNLPICAWSYETATVGVLWKKVFLKISQNSQENTSARCPFLIKKDLRPATVLKRDSGTDVFLWILRNFKNTFFKEHLRWLHLKIVPWKFGILNPLMHNVPNWDIKDLT